MILKNPNRSSIKTLIYFMIVFSFLYMICAPNFIYNATKKCTERDKKLSRPCHHEYSFVESIVNYSQIPQNLTFEEKTQLHHIVFGIGASSKLWESRKKYIKLWWRPHEMRGFAWLDKKVQNQDLESLPQVIISSNTSKFKYENKHGDRSAIRISRIVSEIVRLGLDNVRWIVLGDDDTFFVSDNVVRVLSKYDHNQFYYIGSYSESHIQNIHFSYNMAYGGGGFAISYPLAKALEKMQDGCIERYPFLYGSDDRIHACMAELGVPLTKEVGFHQLDIYGNPLGLLAAHPIAPFVSLHHLDLIDPIFPKVDQARALERLKMPMKLDSAALMQQSICHDKARNWTVSISWGYAAQIYRGLIPAREMAMPVRTFVNWYRTNGGDDFSFNTRSLANSGCESPFTYVLSNALLNPLTNRTASEYVRSTSLKSECNWKMADPSDIHRVEVYKTPNPNMWEKPPRRNCCRILPTRKEGTVAVDVGECREGETI